MTPRIAAFVLSGSLALAGCALVPTSTPGTPTMSSCGRSPCAVTVNHEGPWPFFGLDVAEEVDVTGAPPVVITWTLTTPTETRFHHTKGIVFGDPRFDCRIDQKDDRIYTCTDNAPAGRYKYTIRTIGAGAPLFPKDPWIVNR